MLEGGKRLELLLYLVSGPGLCIIRVSANYRSFVDEIRSRELPINSTTTFPLHQMDKRRLGASVR